MDIIGIDKMYDKGFRQALLSHPERYAKEFGLADGVELVVKKNSKDTIYIAFPSTSLDDKSISSIHAAIDAGSAGTAATLSTAGTAASLSSTYSTLSSATTVGTIGSLA